MRKVKVWTVIWTSEHDTDAVARFKREADAVEFSRGKRHYQDQAEPFSDMVPSHIASRWGL